MPLGIVSDEDFESEVEFIIDPLMGRGSGNTEVPGPIREIIAEESINGARASELSKLFNVSESSISAYKHGSTSTSSYNEPNESLKKHVDDVRLNIRDSARRSLIEALSHITPDKLAKAKLRDVAAVAKDLSVVAANHDTGDNSKSTGVQFHFHVTPTKKESDFEVIDVSQ